MSFKYFAWRDRRGYMCGQKLVPMQALASMRRTLTDHEVFASVQTYDEAGLPLYCPLYADLDGNAKQALFDAQYIVYLLGEMTNVVPDIYYSGNRGYHIIVPFKVDGPHCHLVAGHFFKYLANDIPTLDRRVYTERRLLRLPNSVASRPGYFKVQISRDELMGCTPEQITELGRAPRPVLNECDTSKLNQEFMDVIAAGNQAIPRWAGQDVVEYATTLGEELTPCMVRMLNREPDKGERNQTVCLIARLFKKSGLTEQEVLENLLSRPHSTSFEQEEHGVSNAVRGIYRSRRPAVLGCKMGNDAALMKRFCDPLCWFNDTRINIDFQERQHG